VTHRHLDIKLHLSVQRLLEHPSIAVHSNHVQYIHIYAVVRLKEGLRHSRIIIDVKKV
jgi:hypothetical protein